MANKKIPMRQCIGCGEMKPKKEMIRVIKTAEDEIILDTTGRKNGRGAYICPESECLQKAIKWKNLRPDKVLSMLGIAAKSGSVVSGEFSTEKAVKEGRAYLVIVAGDSSDNTKKMFSNMTDFYEVPMYIYSDKETLGHCIGKEFRASLAIVNEGLAHSVEDKLKQTITTE